MIMVMPPHGSPRHTQSSPYGLVASRLHTYCSCRHQLTVLTARRARWPRTEGAKITHCPPRRISSIATCDPLSKVMSPHDSIKFTLLSSMSWLNQDRDIIVPSSSQPPAAPAHTGFWAPAAPNLHLRGLQPIGFLPLRQSACRYCWADIILSCLLLPPRMAQFRGCAPLHLLISVWASSSLLYLPPYLSDNFQDDDDDDIIFVMSLLLKTPKQIPSEYRFQVVDNSGTRQQDFKKTKCQRFWFVFNEMFLIFRYIMCVD
jgi:hypothetical protein